MQLATSNRGTGVGTAIADVYLVIWVFRRLMVLAVWPKTWSIPSGAWRERRHGRRIEGEGEEEVILAWRRGGAAGALVPGAAVATPDKHAYSLSRFKFS